MKLIAPILPILFVLASSMVIAATIEGTIYDIELNSISNALVEIDTTPKQSFVSKDSAYSFDVPIGEYTIKATHEQGIAEEKLIIKDDGTYNIDLILFPDFSEEEEILDESDLEIGTDSEYTGEISHPAYYFLGFLAALVILIFVILRYKRKLETALKKEIAEIKETKKEDAVEKDLKELLSFIKKEGGRTTQKDIRKHFPQSEAKVSLMISELEHTGKIKKIKKGRGNIITLR